MTNNLQDITYAQYVYIIVQLIIPLDLLITHEKHYSLSMRGNFIFIHNDAPEVLL
ncbi:DNA protection during starvation protein [Enterobacter hormaechei ATCC 49162]|nr:DNA protection during starvation protein [Enterobacter hormaechei ATCC 49162]